MNKWEEGLENRPARTLLKALLLGVLILAIVLAFGWFVRMIFFFPNQAGRLIENTFNAENVIYNYEWFKRQYNEILAFETRIGNAKASLAAFEASAGPRSGWGFEENQEWNRLNAIVLGLSNQRAGMVAEYNARAAMVNRSIFMGTDVPEHIN